MRIVACLSAVALCTTLAPTAEAFDLQPISVPVTVGGVSLHIPVTASLDVEKDGETVRVKARADADLGELQKNALQIARGLPWPSDGCKKKNKPNPVVNEITGATLTADGSKAIVSLDGDVTVWMCAKLAGQKMKVEGPRVAVKTSAPFELYLPNPRQVSARVAGQVRVETPDDDVRPALEALMDGLQDKLAEKLDKVVDEASAKAMLPALEGVDLKLTSVRFATEDGALHVVAEGGGAAPASAFDKLMEKAQKHG